MKNVRIVMAAGAVALLANAANATICGECPPVPERVKNVIVLVPDGCNATVQTIARWYKGRDLMVDSMTHGSMKTWLSNTIIAGSAGAATAFATGIKSNEPAIGVGPRSTDTISGYQFPFPKDILSYRPLATVLEAAKASGRSTGLVATSTISHATPASFSAHIDSRGKEFEIIEQQVYQNIDVVFGGAYNKLIPKAINSKGRADQENLKDTLISRGYQFVQTKTAMASITSGRVWGMFSGEAMQPDIDRSTFGPNEPSLAEMTAKAIELLSQDQDGFFLFVEGSQVDWANHNNDPIYAVQDFIAFDEAVRVAVEYARSNGQTAVIAFSDHNTGGMSLGSYESDKRVAYDAMTPQFLVDPLKKMTLSSQGVATKLYSGVLSVTLADSVKVRDTVAAYWGVTLTNSQITEVFSWPYSTSLNYRLAAVVSKYHTAIGWTTHGHNGEDVPIWAYGTAGYGITTIDNTQIPKHIFNIMGVDYLQLNANLFVDINQYFSGLWTITADANGNKTVALGNSVKPAFSAKLPVDKDEVYITERVGGVVAVVKHRNPGVTVYAPATNRVYIPQATVDLIRAKYTAFY